MRHLMILFVALAAFAVIVGSDALAIGADPGGANVDWRPLHRALHLPVLSAGQRCPVSLHATAITGERYGISGALGSGPVYPILPSGSLVVSYRPHEWGRSAWAGEKVFWFVHPRYQGPVLIRGSRLDGRGSMRFDGGRLPQPEIRISPGETTHWSGQVAGSRGRPSYVRVRAAGCYAAQVDGTAFSRVVVFIVSGPK